MTIKNILALPIDPHTNNSILTSALCIAKNFGAHIDFTHVKGDPSSYTGPMIEGLPPDVMREMENERARWIQENEDSVRGSFEDFIAHEELSINDKPGSSDKPSASWVSITGGAPEVLSERGGAYDLIVLGRPLEPSSYAYAVMEAALFATGRPVLLAPPDPPDHIGETVLVAWNRSAQSARAFHAAKALVLHQAKKIKILSIATGAKQGPPASEIAENLRWHGIEAELRELAPDNQSIGDVLLGEASAINADLLVMGAFSHSRVRQMIFGGVTKHLLENTTLPVLMAN
jgi:nucleotide-binding universal stress UspA family protein